MKRADSLLAPLILNLGIGDAVTLRRIRNDWGVIFEKPISLHTTPAALKEGELLINVDSPVWLQELNFYKDTLTKKLRDFGVKTVRLKIGRIPLEKKYDRLSPERKALTADDIFYIENTVSSITDQELRDRIKKAIEKSITFKRHC